MGFSKTCVFLIARAFHWVQVLCSVLLMREAHEAFSIFTYWAKHLKRSEKPLLAVCCWTTNSMQSLLSCDLYWSSIEYFIGVILRDSNVQDNFSQHCRYAYTHVGLPFCACIICIAKSFGIHLTNEGKVINNSHHSNSMYLTSPILASWVCYSEQAALERLRSKQADWKVFCIIEAFVGSLPSSWTV